MFKTPDGKVVVIYYQPMPKRVNVQGTDVYFDCQHGLSLAFVDESQVAPMLAFKGGCCGGKRQVIYLATEVQYKHWLDGNGGR